MLSFASPIWLAGLAVIPLIWWLHRQGDPNSASLVSASFLFYNQVDETKLSRALPPANPIWILRATLFGLLVLALAGMGWLQNQERVITIWFDNSLSMHAIEDGRTRIAIAAQRLADALDEADPAKVEILLLGEHLEKLDASALAGELRLDAINRWLGLHMPERPQIPFHLSRGAENWLVSDGANQVVNAWMKKAGFSHTITVGGLTENTAITTIMARRALQPATQHHGSVRVKNLGAVDSARTLTVYADDQVIFTDELEIKSGDKTFLNFRIPTHSKLLRAVLLPADTLSLDDTLETDLSMLRPAAVDFDERCGSHLGAALRAHPGLALHAGADKTIELSVQCGVAPGISASASIFVHIGNNYQAVKGPVHWHQPVPGLSGMFLDHSWVLINPESARPPSDHTLLSSPDMEFALIDTQAGVVDVFMDLESVPIVERLEYPLLVNMLVELALARPVLDPIVRAKRNSDESRITRQPIADISDSQLATKQTRTDLTPYLITLAMLLLLLDTLILLRAIPRRRYVRSAA